MTERKSTIYLRLSERAAENIKTWPKWMQNNLTPPREIKDKKK